MKTVKEFETETGLSIPNIYWYDHNEHKYGTITLICMAITPTGRISKSTKGWQQYRVYQKGKYTTDKQAAIDRALSNITIGKKLPKGCKWSEPLMQHDFWDRKIH